MVSYQSLLTALPFLYILLTKWYPLSHTLECTIFLIMNKPTSQKGFLSFSGHKMCLLALLSPFINHNDWFPSVFTNFNYEKGNFFGRSLPLWTIVGSTPPSSGLLSFYQNSSKTVENQETSHQKYEINKVRTTGLGGKHHKIYYLKCLCVFSIIDWESKSEQYHVQRLLYTSLT